MTGIGTGIGTGTTGRTGTGIGTGTGIRTAGVDRDWDRDWDWEVAHSQGSAPSNSSETVQTSRGIIPSAVRVSPSCSTRTRRCRVRLLDQFFNLAVGVLVAAFATHVASAQPLVIQRANAIDVISGSIQPQRTIMFAFGQDEEVGGSKGNGQIAQALASRRIHFAWVLDEGPSILTQPYPGIHHPVAFIANGEKGYLSLTLTAHGQGGHSARPSHDLALTRLSSAVLNVVGHPFTSDLDDIQREKFAVLAPLAPFGQRMLLANLWLTKPLVLRQLDDILTVASSTSSYARPKRTLRATRFRRRLQLERWRGRRRGSRPCAGGRGRGPGLTGANS